MPEITFTVLDGAGARPHVDALRDLYAEVYAEPPYNEGPAHVRQFVRWISEELDRPGFSLALAQAGDGLAGAAYGFTMPAGEWMEPRASEPPPALLDVPKLNVAEWMVRKPYRGAGAGRRLLDLLLAGRPEPYAILASNPAALARSIYERWGWTKQGIIRPRSMPQMDVLVRPLPPPDGS